LELASLIALLARKSKYSKPSEKYLKSIEVKTPIRRENSDRQVSQSAFDIIWRFRNLSLSHGGQLFQKFQCLQRSGAHRTPKISDSPCWISVNEIRKALKSLIKAKNLCGVQHFFYFASLFSINNNL